MRRPGRSETSSGKRYRLVCSYPSLLFDGRTIRPRLRSRETPLGDMRLETSSFPDPGGIHRIAERADEPQHSLFARATSASYFDAGESEAPCSGCRHLTTARACQVKRRSVAEHLRGNTLLHQFAGASLAAVAKLDA